MERRDYFPDEIVNEPYPIVLNARILTAELKNRACALLVGWNGRAVWPWMNDGETPWGTEYRSFYLCESDIHLVYVGAAWVYGLLEPRAPGSQSGFVAERKDGLFICGILEIPHNMAKRQEVIRSSGGKLPIPLADMRTRT